SKDDSPRLTPPTESHLGAGMVTVVIPAYNEGDGIKLTLSTVDEMAEDKKRIEVIVVDGGCKDHTMEAVASMKIKIPISTTTSTGGRGPALNAGARLASGDLLLFLHADTVLPRGFDTILREAFSEPQVLMTSFRFGVNRALLQDKEPFALGLMEGVTNYRTRKLH
ncbi:unnamed protein product, partial [Choristocarpus tenellus]